MKYKALRNHCIVKVEREEMKSTGGIIMATKGMREDMAREEGILMDIGSDFYLDSPGGYKGQVKIGDKVTFARYGGKSLGEDKEGNELRVMHDTDLLAVKLED